MSSNDDFNGPSFRPARGREADQDSGGASGGTAGPGAGGAPGSRYPAPEGWGKDGFWSDPAIDSDYETGLTGAVRPADEGPRDEPGYSYWADGKGWQSSPGKSGRPGDATSLDAARAAAGPGDATRMDMRNRAGGAPAFYDAAGATAAYRGPGGPGGPGRGPGGPGGPGGRGPGRRGAPADRRKGRWWRHWTWKKAAVLSGGVLAIFGLALAGSYYYLYSTTEIPAALANVLDQETVVYYSDGTTPIGTIGLVDRQNLSYNQIPKNLQDAVLAAEDRGFWTEGGISMTGIMRAAYDNLMSSGGNLSGGSTITQEFVRGYYQDIGSQQTIGRKIKEVFVAQKLVTQKSKQWILTNYLNMIYLGEGSYGVAAAAQTYFGEPVSKLTVAQDAVIAAIIQQPSNFPLVQYRQDLITRWHYVLNGMVTMGDLTQAQADSMKFPKLLTDSAASAPKQTSYTANSSDPWAPYIMNVVENELTGVDHIPTSELETGGLRVVTTISRPMETEMYKAVNQNIREIKAEGYTLPSYALIGAELQDPKTGSIVALYPGPGQNMSKADCEKYLCDLNTAVYAREQVGSSFKPYVLSTAVSQGMNVKTSILNASGTLYVPPDSMPMVLSTTDKKKAVSGSLKVSNDTFTNFGGRGGAISVQKALALSSNTAYTDLAHRATTSSIIKMAASMGVNIAPTPTGSNLSQMVGQVGLALGTASLTVNEQTTMLSTIANNGVYHQAHIVKYWQLSADGTRHKPIVQSHPVLNPNPVTNAQMASQVQYAMEATTVYGTGTAAAQGLGNRQIIGKTGTTSNAHSAFFIGAIPQYSLVVGIFTKSQNTNSPENLAALGGGGFGGSWPARIWNTFAMAEFANLPMENFQSPVFTGAKWDQVGKLPPKKKNPKCATVKFRGKRFPVANCPSPSASPTLPGGLPTPSVQPSFSLPPTQFPTPPTPGPSGSATGTATPTSTPTAAAVVLALPGSLLWASASRRRRRRRQGRGRCQGRGR